VPRVNIYITNDNWERWRSLDNKSAYVNNVLRYDVGAAVAATRGAVCTASSSVAPIPPTIDADGFCPHGRQKGFCTQGCFNKETRAAKS
jgi:hypothetical protein